MKPPLAWPLIGLLSLTGIAMGLLTSLGALGDTMWGELLAWTGFALVWIAVVRSRRAPRPFLTIVLVSAIGGVLFGAVNQVLWDPYVDNHPVTFEEPTRAAGQDPYGGSVRAMNFALSIAIGAVWGALIGGLAVALDRWRPVAVPA